MTIWTNEYLKPLIHQLSIGRPQWLVQRQYKALDKFLKNGFPNKNQQAWQYTSTKFIKENKFKLSNSSDIFKKKFSSFDKHTAEFDDLVFINGYYFENLSSIDTLTAKNLSFLSLKNLSQDKENFIKNAFVNIDFLKILDAPFLDLAQALLTDCLFINIPADVQLEKPIRVLHLTDHNFSFRMRHVFCLFQLGNNAKAIIFEDFKSLKTKVCFSNYVTLINLGKNAQLNYYNSQPLSKKAAHNHQLILLQAEDSDYQHYDVAQGAEFARNDRRIYLQGKKAKATLKGVFSVAESRCIDHYIHVNHGESQTVSNQLYKGLASDHSHAIFNSHVLVPKTIQKAVAAQLSKNLLLSSDAAINLKPTLEIYADDVACSHGATIGAIDEKALFYFCSRGIDKEKAKQLLKQGFLTEVLETIPHSSCRKQVNYLL